MKKTGKWLLILSLFLCSCSRRENVDFLGNSIGNLDLSDTEIGLDFALRKIDSKTLLHLIESNGYSYDSRKKIGDTIRKSRKLFLSVGMYDLLKNVGLENGDLVFRYHSSTLELFEMNLVHIVDAIRSYNEEASILIFSLYHPYEKSGRLFYDDFTLGLDLFNRCIEEVCEENRCRYIDISACSSNIESFNCFDDNGLEKLTETIAQYE